MSEPKAKIRSRILRTLLKATDNRLPCNKIMQDLDYAFSTEKGENTWRYAVLDDGWLEVGKELVKEGIITKSGLFYSRWGGALFRGLDDRKCEFVLTKKGKKSAEKAYSNYYYQTR